MLKKFLTLCAIIFATATVTTLTPEPAYADCRNLLGMTSWDCNVNLNNVNSEDQLINNVWIIASNVLSDASVVAAYLVLGYVIYGGYQYILAGGDPGKTASGKKTLTHAFIGLAIVMLSYVILNAIRIALMGSSGVFSGNCLTTGTGCVDPVDFTNNVINWFIGIAGVVSLIYVVIGGIGYVTSAGDPGKLKKAKDTIMYALIGLAIVALAEIITAFVTNIIRNADSDSTSFITNTLEETTHENHLC